MESLESTGEAKASGAGQCLDFLGQSGQDHRVTRTKEDLSRADVGTLLDRFSQRATLSPSAVPGTSHFPGLREGPHVVIGFITHGNEWGTLPAALWLQRDLAEGAIPLAGPVTLLLGNREAALRNERYLEEDFNRVFTFDRSADNLERRRADEVRPLLDAADFFLDFHQTQTPTESAFWTLPWTGDLPLWARAIGGAPVGLTRRAGGVFSAGKCCLDEYVRIRGKMGITLEVGMKGPDLQQAELTYASAKRFIHAVTRLTQGTASLDEIAAQQPNITWFETREIVQAVTHEHRLRPGLGNWTPVQGGELLSAVGAPEIRASVPGRILFPKYPRPSEPPPPELFRLAVPVEDPNRLFAPR